MVLTVVLIYFFYFHLTLLVFNLTTIDYIDKGKMKIANTSGNFYFLSICDSIRQVMGTFVSWFIPIAPQAKYDGYSFDVNKEQYHRAMIEKLNEAALKKGRRFSGLLSIKYNTSK